MNVGKEIVCKDVIRQLGIDYNTLGAYIKAMMQKNVLIRKEKGRFFVTEKALNIEVR